VNRERLLRELWYGRHPLSLALAPLGWAVSAVARVRRLLYRTGILIGTHVGVPVVVVGNLAVGGTGKTPLVVWLAGFLASRGWRPGIVCRGYGGNATRWPQPVRADSDPAEVGDEAVLLARRAACPVVASGPRRALAATEMVRHTDCDVVISDDGLQHLALERDVEIAVLDGVRRHGNGRCLPAGPLREPLGRLRAVDLVVANGAARRGEFAMTLVPGPAINLAQPSRRRPLAEFSSGTVHAVCGIGNPGRFFSMLAGLGVSAMEHPFPDHHPFAARDLDFGDAAAVLMTEKDAVKCQSFARPEHWYVPVTAELSDAFCTRLERLLAEAVNAQNGAHP